KFQPDMVAGHSLGEISALVANKTLDFSDGLKLVYKRALAMQHACEITPSTMAAVLGLEDNLVEIICADTPGIVVAANYNCPGQLVISGDVEAVGKACESLKEAGARRALILPVGGAFHSPLMEPAREELAAAIEATNFKEPACPIYQNVSTFAVTDPSKIKENLIFQLTAPVKWTQSVQNMITDGATKFIEVGPGNVLKGLVKKIDASAETEKAEMSVCEYENNKTPRKTGSFGIIIFRKLDVESVGKLNYSFLIKFHLYQIWDQITACCPNYMNRIFHIDSV